MPIKVYKYLHRSLRKGNPIVLYKTRGPINEEDE